MMKIRTTRSAIQINVEKNCKDITQSFKNKNWKETIQTKIPSKDYKDATQMLKGRNCNMIQTKILK